MPLILDENQSSTGMFTLLHDSWNAFPTFALIDHTMTVRAKPWTLENNSNTSSCDGTNNTISGWSGGSTENFIQQLVDECGDLCQDGGCSLTSGDVNEDEILNIQDIITMVNQILGSMSLADCALEAADMNMDGIINIQDLISLVNAILGTARSANVEGKANIEYITSGEDMLVQIDSEVEIAGIQISFFNTSSVDIELKDNSHITQASNYQDGIHRYLAYSIFNTPFDSRTPEIFIKSAGSLNLDDIEIIVADINGNALPLSKAQGTDIVHSNNFEISKLSPNPFNPSTQISFNLPLEGHVRLTAYDVRGQEVDVIFEGAQSMGEHSYTWHANDLPSGLYYVRLQSGALITTKKAVLIK